jgi:hypothetical protein
MAVREKAPDSEADLVSSEGGEKLRILGESVELVAVAVDVDGKQLGPVRREGDLNKFRSGNCVGLLRFWRSTEECRRIFHLLNLVLLYSRNEL